MKRLNQTMTSSFEEVKGVISDIDNLLAQRSSDPKLNASFHLISQTIEYSKRLLSLNKINNVNNKICIAYIGLFYIYIFFIEK